MFNREIYAEETGGERKDCAVRAFSVAACVSYSTAQEIYQRHGRNPNKGTPFFVTERVMATEFPDALFTTHNDITLPKFVRLYNKGHYLVHVRGHALAVVDGVIHDWRPRPKTKVRCAWRLV
jgi:hypothetical protein